jgi:predicted aspartyl protease
VPVRIRGGHPYHPYIDILVSPDAKATHKHTALIDTGFSGFISLSAAAATKLDLRALATTRYILANGLVSDPIPLAYGYACLEGDSFVQGLFAISEQTSTVIGMNFLTRCGKVLVLSSAGRNHYELGRIQDRPGIGGLPRIPHLITTADKGSVGVHSVTVSAWTPASCPPLIPC